MRKLAEIVYNNTLKVVLKGIPKKDVEEVSKRYMEYVSETVTSENDNPPKILIEMLVDGYTEEFQSMNPNEIRNFFLIDQNYNSLCDIRLIINENLNQNTFIGEEEYLDLVKKIDVLSSNVRDYNRRETRNIRKNLLTDLNFIAGKSEDLSPESLKYFLRNKGSRIIG